MSSAVGGSRGRTSRTTASSRGSARLGATVRGVIVSPGTAFVPALKRAETTEEARSTFVLAALGGAAAMLLWLKIRALVGIRPLARSDFDWSFLFVWLILAALVAVAGQVVWSFVAPRAGGTDAGSPRSFRAVWAFSAFPQIAALLVLAPLDFLLVGEAAFTASDDGDTVALAWMALSTALAVSLAVWSAYVFVKGTGAATRAPAGRTAGVVAASVVSVIAIVALVVAALAGLAKVTS